MRAWMLVGLGLLSASGDAARGTAPPGPSVVELFTSQGCSSCPPAETVLGELSGRPDVIPIAFHVDYWDGGGWRDRYAIPEAVRRQTLYARTLHLSSPFTPQAVVDGRASFVGSDRREIASALAESAESVPVILAIGDGVLRIEVPERATHDEFDVNLAAYLSRAITAVGRGENSGRSLTEYNIVRQFTRVATWSGSARSYSVPLSSLPPDADRVAVFVQRANQGPISGAAAVALPDRATAASR